MSGVKLIKNIIHATIVDVAVENICRNTRLFSDICAVFNKCVFYIFYMAE